jgi:hypothetical protein
MEYFAGMDVSMSETHVCVVSQDGAVVHEVRAPSTPAGIAPRSHEFRPVGGSCSRRAGWRRCCTMA